MVFTYMKSKLLLFNHHLNSSTTMLTLLSFPCKNLSAMSIIPSFSTHKHLIFSVSRPILVKLSKPRTQHTFLISKVPKELKFWHCLVGLLAVCFVRVERVPYSKKIHFIFLTPKLVNSILVKIKMIELEEAYGNSILAPTNPKSIKVMNIVRDIAQAMHNGLELEKDFSIRAFIPDKKDGPILGPSLLVGKSIDFGGLRDNEIMKFVRICSTKHLEGRQWKVILVDTYFDNAEMCPDGTIIIYSKVLDLHGNLPFTISHEFGHAIARHSDLSLLRIIVVTGLLTWLLKIRQHRLLPMSTIIELFFSRRDELEADHIGMMLMASAGFDPQAAPARFRKSESENDFWSDIRSSHPNHSKRAESLENPKKMKIAMAVYRAALAARSREAYT